ncbi:MAG TPA: glutamate-1-semialdehyde 2,1-aminomutase, partial [Deltaproteobacteria bacterium]|nr:glutamate-1-semialdehyde 2,1-aminomutase [Deltaproteobacteria bacterium]HPR55147.1 glutamate-1-semialdehyde 2,1-aminomutase [Deltaproteobacteria bacterium]HXK47272.1 glutamate-1-semialdehyde 2,1-aminomutase [Deltaproteobacteria bacterium]
MTNKELFEAAQRIIPGGVNSPVRAFRKVGGVPRFMAQGSGPFLTDAEGKRYIDFVLSWGPLILGHCHPAVVEAVRRQAGIGMSYGAPTDLEVEMAALVCEAFPAMDKVRFVSSGTEATMSAIRLARAATGRQVTVKFEGCYHGHADSLLVKAGSGLLTLGVPDSSGIPENVASTTAVLPYNDTAAFGEFMDSRGTEVASVIVEPVAGNMGVVLPRKGFLQSIRAKTKACGSLLIFDEVITGFRFRFGGYQELAGITPDLTCLGKIVGGGMPAAAFGGRADLMDQLSPNGPVYQAGTLSGNPLAMAAGIAALKVLKDSDPYAGLDRTMASFTSGLEELAKKAGIALAVNRVGSMAGVFFRQGPVETFDDVMASDASRYTRFFHAMLERGVYLAPSPFEAAFVSTA